MSALNFPPTESQVAAEKRWNEETHVLVTETTKTLARGEELLARLGY